MAAVRDLLLRELPPGGRGRQAVEELQPLRLPGGTRDVGGDNIGRVPVQAAAGSVIPHRGTRIGVRGGLLHVTQRDPGIQSGGDERVAKRVGRDGLADARSAGDPPHDPPGAVPVQPPPIRSQKHKPAIITQRDFRSLA